MSRHTDDATLRLGRCPAQGEQRYVVLCALAADQMGHDPVADLLDRVVRDGIAQLADAIIEPDVAPHIVSLERAAALGRDQDLW